jgi:hypothetical protein
MAYAVERPARDGHAQADVAWTLAGAARRRAEREWAMALP